MATADIKEKIKSLYTEASIYRVWQHFESDKSIVCLTAYRGENTKSENTHRNKQLGTLIRQAGYDYFEVDGYYVEETGQKVKEKSLFVVDNHDNDEKFIKLFISLGKNFDQDSIFYKSPDGGNYLIGTRTDSSVGGIGKKLYLGGEFKPNKMGEFYSKIKGRPYVFEDSVYEEKAFNGSMGATIIRKKLWSNIEEYDVDGIEVFLKTHVIT